MGEVFWTSFIIVIYSYGGYGLITLILIKLNLIFKRGNSVSHESNTKTIGSSLPSISLIIAAYNEENIIFEKALNSLQLDYDKDLLEILFVIDGTTDSTEEILNKVEGIQVLYLPKRSGKTAAVNRAVKLAKNDILVFCDANTLLNKESLQFLAKHYEDPRIGGVSGEKKIKIAEGIVASGGEGIYWKYESYLKKLDSQLYSVVGAAGELFSVRKNLYESPEEDTIIDDFVISLRINLKGYKIAYEPRAYAEELASASIKEEKKRKVRICAGGFQAISRLPDLFKFWKHLRLTFLYISHRVLRWTLCPVLLPIIFITNLFLLSKPFYVVFLTAQIVFYLLGMVGWIQSSQVKAHKIFYIPFYFIFMNLSVFQGFNIYIRGKQSAVWERSERALNP